MDTMKNSGSKFSKFMFVAVLVTWCSVSCVGQNQWKDVYRESAWKERDSWQRAPELIKQLQLKSESSVADIGSHEGYMTIKLAGVVKAGRVYAVDVNAQKLALLKEHLSARHIDNVTAVQGDYDDPKLPTGTLDGVIILDTYHEMDDHDKILQRVKEALKKNGRLVICEPIAPSRRELTRTEQEAKHEVAMAFVKEDLIKAGFTILSQQDPFVDRMEVKGDVMWMLVAQK